MFKKMSYVGKLTSCMFILWVMTSLLWLTICYVVGDPISNQEILEITLKTGLIYVWLYGCGLIGYFIGINSN